LNKPRGLAQGLEVFGMKPYAQPQPPHPKTPKPQKGQLKIN